MSSKKLERFKYRYRDSFLGQYSILNKAEEEYLKHEENPSRQAKHEFGKEIKHTYEFGWKTMKDYLREKGINSFLPRKIIRKMQDYISADGWISMLEDINTYILTNEEEHLDIVIKNYFLSYKKLFEQFCEFFDKEIQKDFEALSKKFKPQYPNHSVLDSYSFCLFINYFLKNKKIDYVRIYGSRSGYGYRRASDIDFLIGGNFSDEEFTQIDRELKSLKHPYMLDVTNVNDISTEQKKSYVEVSLANSIPFFDRKDFV